MIVIVTSGESTLLAVALHTTEADAPAAAVIAEMVRTLVAMAVVQSVPVAVKVIACASGSVANKLTTISDMWNTIASVLTDVTVTEDDTIDLNPIEMRSYVGDYRLLEEVIGWQPRVNLQDGVKLTVESLK